MAKSSNLEDLRQELADDRSLPLRGANLVFGEGDPSAKVLFVGEAPGFHEDQQQRPFVGRSGKLLDKMLEDIGWKRENVYITNVVKRRPPENRDPLPEEIAAYTPYLERQISIIDPKIIVTLGRFAMSHISPQGKISRDQGKVFWWKERIFMPMYHPAAALRSTSVLEDLKKSFQKLPKIIKKYDELKKEHLNDVGAPEEEKNQEALF
ncbi:MAG: hypothetical protein COT88_02060 [Candidatus Colwellbacteria bacterium CG10_big_fil_rev_8_21_14_0_10_41_28]|uniref:Type-4 uracil-DNA glycosylase n=1 Tax=Candidatus Colwellbacteria bacterium CG10_big_fil_rev_8_21_14_0_10_41_28 TaxID=1974539 RepID=A0A2H0VGX1_9BACT|nr:MAG: hypothetical protein COT88_02060 [Candidatus Colwellbacteria bacterium CG10_big_fil_rev_8_21_14_0_10_41_28]